MNEPNTSLKEAIVLTKTGQKLKARQILREIIQADPKNSQAWYVLSFIVDKREQQLECLHRALKFEPGYQDAKKRLEKIELSHEPIPNLKSIEKTSKVEIDSSKPSLDSLLKLWFKNLTYQESKVLEYLYLDPRHFSVDAVGRIVGETSKKVTLIKQRALSKLSQSKEYEIGKPLVEWYLTNTKQLEASSDTGALNILIQREWEVTNVDPFGVCSLIFAFLKESNRSKPHEVSQNDKKTESKSVAVEKPQKLKHSTHKDKLPNINDYHTLSYKTSGFENIFSPVQGPDIALKALGLRRRTYNALFRGGISSVNQLVRLSEEELSSIRNIGETSIVEIQNRLKQFSWPQISANVAETYVQKESSTQPVTVENLIDKPMWKVPSLPKDIPIDNISIERLRVSEFSRKWLERNKVNFIGELFEHKEKIKRGSDLVKSLDKYLAWLVEQDKSVWFEEVTARGLNPLSKQELSNTTFDALISQLIELLSQRESQVIVWRYGIYGTFLTLQEIGDKFNVSRERIRQIERKGLRKLKGLYKGKGRELLEPILDYLKIRFEEHQGLLSESDITSIFFDDPLIKIQEVNAVNSLALLSVITDKLQYFKKHQLFADTHVSIELVSHINKSFCDLLSHKLTPQPPSFLLNEFKQTSFYREIENTLSDEFLLACLRVNFHVEQLESGFCTLANSSNKRLGAIITALREIGEPAHYSVIAEKTNTLLAPEEHFTVRALHAKLGQHPDIFVWVRLRGTYGLKEWGLERELSYVDACVYVLEGAGHPLSFEQVLAKLPEVRQFFDENSVLLTLSTHERFQTFSNKYGLAKWNSTLSKADFADLFGNQLAQRQAELERQNQSSEIDTQKEVDTIRKLGLDFFSD